MIFAAQTVKRIIDTIGKEYGNKLCFHPIETDRGCLIKLGGLFLFIFFQKKGVNIIFQLGMKALVVSPRILYIIADPSIDIRMADGISNIMTDKTAQKSHSLFLLLLGFNPGKAVKGAAEKIIYTMLVHIGAYISVVSVAQDREIVKKHIRPLKSQLIQPAVLCNDKLKIVGRKVIICLHS